MLTLETPLQFLKGVGPKMAPKLYKLGIRTIQDLIYYFPRAWQDFTKITLISQLKMGQEGIIQGKIRQINNQRSPKRRMIITSAIVQDRVGDTIKLVWFNQPYLTQNLRVGEEWIFCGRVEYNWQLKEKTIHSPIYEKNSAILPIYSETQGITSKYLRSLLKNALTSLSSKDFLPTKVLQSQNLIELNQAIREIHFPSSNSLLLQAKTRLAFDELFLIVLKMQLARLAIQNQGAPKISINKDLLVKFTKSLTYQLTNAQRKASWEIIQDLTKPYPMNRLLNGDVGSGKTIVALIAALNCVSNRYQVAWMAPTEILAEQHYETACKLLKPFGVKVSLLTGSGAKISEASIKNQVSSISSKSKILNTKYQILDTDLIIGTHALIQEGIKLSNLGLVIIDEQHRFGVKQREELQSKKLKSYKLIPHYLSMTATPIPRTLALSLYGDLDISVLDEMPVGRKAIITRLVDPVNRQKAYDFIREQIKKGRQAFVICPIIEIQNSKFKIQNDHSKLKSPNLFEIEKKSVKKEYERLSKEIFPNLKIAMLHGKMKHKEKEQIMQDFRQGKYDLLVSTSVIEVGVDIPNATIMMIEDADRFGLAQLHQFRGRVGRGQYQSYCLLFTNNLSSETQKRLQAVVECSDGFKLAEKDLEIRGPGELTGINQSGLPDLKMASLTDIMLVRRAKAAAEDIISEGLNQYPLLQEKLEEFANTKHLE